MSRAQAAERLLPKSEPAYPPPGRAWAAVGVLFLLYIVSLLDRNLLLLLIAPAKKELGLSDFDISLVQGAAFSICFVVAALPFGWAVDRASRRGVVLFSVTAWSVATIASGLSRSFGQFFVARSGVGLGEAGLIPAAQSMLADLFPRDRLALPMSIYGLGARLGTSLSFLLVGYLTVFINPDRLYRLPALGALSGWKLIFVVAALPGLLLAPAMLLIREPARQHLTGRSAGGGYAEYGRFIARHRRFIVGHHLGYITVVAVATAVTTWAPAFLARRYHLSPLAVGTSLGTALLIGALASLPVHGRIVDWLYARGTSDATMRYMKWMTLAATPFGVAAFYLHDFHLAIASLGFFFALCGCYISLPLAALQLVMPGEFRGRSSAIIVLVGGIASFGIAPSIVAALTDFVFKDPTRVGDSIAVCIVAAMPFAAAMQNLCLAPMRQMVTEAERIVVPKPQ